MKFADFIRTDAICPDLQATDKPGVIREMVESLRDAGEIEDDDVEDIIQAILNREELGSTGIGRGVAVPHTKHPRVRQPIGTVGISRKGVDFKALDGDVVYLFFLLVSPKDRPGDHLLALENISLQVRDDMFCRFLKQAETVGAVKELLEETDAKQAR